MVSQWSRDGSGVVKAVVSEYIVPAVAICDAWKTWGRDANNGNVHIRRVRSVTGVDDADAWGIFPAMQRLRLHRMALAWRDAWPMEPITHPDDRLVSAPPHRVAIAEAFEWEPSPSSREDSWIADHTFTLDEAFRVCGVRS